MRGVDVRAACDLAKSEPPSLSNRTKRGSTFVCSNRHASSVARGLTDGAHAQEFDEAIAEIARVPLAEALARVRNGEIVDGKTIVGLHLAAEALGKP